MFEWEGGGAFIRQTRFPSPKRRHFLHPRDSEQVHRREKSFLKMKRMGKTRIEVVFVA